MRCAGRARAGDYPWPYRDGVLSTRDATLGIASFCDRFRGELGAPQPGSPGSGPRRADTWEAFAAFSPPPSPSSSWSPRIADAGLTPVYEMLDSIIFKKTESESYVERSMWTRVGDGSLFRDEGTRRRPRFGPNVELVRRHIEQYRSHRAGLLGLSYCGCSLLAPPRRSLCGLNI